MKIMKFGGSSIGSPEAIRNVIGIVKSASEETDLVVVFSAFKGVTDQLLQIADMACESNAAYKESVQELENRHIGAVRALIHPSKRSDLLTSIKLLINELESILHGICLIRECSPKSRDFIVGFGERLSTLILAEVLDTPEKRTVYTDTRNLVKTDRTFGNARVLAEQTIKNIRAYAEENQGKILVCTGFIGSTLEGEPTTLGRGGSDYTASIFGAALEADVVEIWTDVDGLMTADPKKVRRAFSVDIASYEEAMELSHFGAKIIYSPTIQPVMKSRIPVRIKNTFKPEHPGTLIQKNAGAGNGGIKGISSIDDIALVTLKGSGLVGMIGVSARMFGALADENINIILITQSSSEYTITIAVTPRDAEPARRALEEEFSAELANHIVDEVRVEKELSAIAVVGDNMRQIPGIAGRVFQALGRNGINIVAIAQGSSERNISFVVDRKNEKKAMNTLHDAFFLSGVKAVNLFLVGVGLIGGRLLEIIKNQEEVLFNEYQIELNLKGVSNSTRMYLSEENIGFNEWRDLLEREGTSTDLDAFTNRMREMNLPNTIFIDCTASDQLQKQYLDILRASISIVTPNKLANSSDQKFFNQLEETAQRHNCAFRYETNVGAGLPVIGTLHEMRSTGDQIYKIEGVLSGTLSYLFNEFDGSIPFSDLVKQAQKKGFTEPDPREDLNGYDVGRKLLILARVAGYQLEFEDLEIENLVPENARNCETTEEFFDKLAESNAHFEKMAEEAASSGSKLCYIATYHEGRATVKLEKIGKDHAFYNLSGTDNIIALYSANYSTTPLVVKGPGAGADVTASGIIADILRVVNTKMYSHAGW